MERNVVRVFVLCPRDSTTIVGYYTLSATALQPTNLPSDLARRLPRYPTLPALLIGRLAADVRYQGQGVGKHLLLSALRRSLHLSAELGAVAVVVDAKDDRAQAFYERHDFRRFADDAYRLFLPLTTVQQLFPPEPDSSS
jgi:GNAT superfamily N-acetyltransferase